MNTALLRRVKATILEEPGRLNMEIPFLPDSSVPCGTAACIAGWTVILARRRGREPFSTTCKRLDRSCEGRHHWLEIEPKARELLGITQEQSSTLFHSDDWPYPFSQRYGNALTDGQRAKVAAQRIEHFIKTGQ